VPMPEFDKRRRKAWLRTWPWLRTLSPEKISSRSPVRNISKMNRAAQFLRVLFLANPQYNYKNLRGGYGADFQPRLYSTSYERKGFPCCRSVPIHRAPHRFDTSTKANCFALRPTQRQG
jgi:hypothetical protein